MQGQMPTITMAQPISADFARWLEQFNEELLFFEHDLRGEFLDQSNLDDKGRPQWVQSGASMMNERGIRYIIGELRSISNKNTYLSYLESAEKERLYDIEVGIIMTITDNLLANSEDYDLNINYFDSIVEKCANITEFTLRRAINAGERRFLKDTSTEHRIIDQRAQQGGLLSGVANIFRGGKH